jgi:hypothetical protein
MSIGYYQCYQLLTIGYCLLVIGYWLWLNPKPYWLWLLVIGHKLLTTNIGYWFFVVETSKSSHINMPSIIKLQKFLKNTKHTQKSFNQSRLDYTFFSIYLNSPHIDFIVLYSLALFVMAIGASSLQNP